MTTAVIGGDGFIGKNLSIHLSNNNINYRVFDKKPSSLNTEFIDVTDIKSLEILKECDSIINLAAEHKDNVFPISLYDQVNVEGAKNICAIAEKFKIRQIIFTSSVAVYGFAEEDTGEDGPINYFNDYGRTKFLAEQVYKKWQNKDPTNRSLVIIRPTVVFGEGNRGNVYNLINQIASKRFLMIGNGENFKSMAYVENIAAFIGKCLSFESGVTLYNYIDKPDYDMNTFVSRVNQILFNDESIRLRVPAILGLLVGYIADIYKKIHKKSNIPISSIRVKKFLKSTSFSSSIDGTIFSAPYSLDEGLKKTIENDFIDY